MLKDFRKPEFRVASPPPPLELVILRYFLGRTMAEAAHILVVARAAAEEDWTYATAWLSREWRRD
jgi:hypothetical protein